MNPLVQTIHHISAIAGDPQVNLDFYTGVLGFRLIKQTINYDDPGTYHFYFGDERGRPGTLLTFFPWSDAYPGVVGSGQVTAIMLAIPSRSSSYWKKRLTSFHIGFSEITRFGERIIAFKDPHGIALEFVERNLGPLGNWETVDITKEVAIKGIAGAVFNSTLYRETASILTEVFSFKKVGENGDYLRYQTNADLGNTIDLWTPALKPGVTGVGTIHHIAFTTDNEYDQMIVRDSLLKRSLSVTPLIDRKYFRSIYFKEKGSILFELATDGPGFLVDESLATLGQQLQLPQERNAQRQEIIKHLKPILLRQIKPMEKGR